MQTSAYRTGTTFLQFFPQLHDIAAGRLPCLFDQQIFALHTNRLYLFIEGLHIL